MGYAEDMALAKSVTESTWSKFDVSNPVKKTKVTYVQASTEWHKIAINRIAGEKDDTPFSPKTSKIKTSTPEFYKSLGKVMVEKSRNASKLGVTCLDFCAYLGSRLVAEGFEGPIEVVLISGSGLTTTGHEFLVVYRDARSDINDVANWGANARIIDVWAAKQLEQDPKAARAICKGADFLNILPASIHTLFPAKAKVKCKLN
jgi:hypothetical protein